MMKSHSAYMALAYLIIAVSCGGRPQMQSAPDYGNKVVGTWEKVGIECDEAGINCKAPKATDSKGNLYESKILTITDTYMVLNQHFQGKWYVNKYQKAE